ncbi:carboxypeptidase regulatory-like domain-containing protein [Leptospira kanakyensis]|uniref:Carboxypeptidase regulatory-like domain-containing protein n=1 Tax=Leptospira kanakyensis TaxID=2484968 RepID=A0A6N4QCN4_9LEPT|nr:carboxypeptidase-like regulatory domain-containing protein [Leptospira kanakyensis]TGK51706.1 carboxypeptidase regulatory-like domain-containing protein [Leptospira kanakyensis]TGK58593.1 carboxypeptidase regulatory-like domain-containing protein [Leptospira kanakyensis]TGK70796.1 carboxypeptidase regulatory-like domain-containing protein [Leptospira kanakyensis]
MKLIIRKLKYSLLLVLLLNLVNCYYNPLVQKVLVPDPKEDSSILLGLPLLGLTPTSIAISITGQIRDETGAAVPNAILTVNSRSNGLDGLDSSATTDSGGRFFIHLSTGSTTFAVTKGGSSYFSFTLLVSSPLDIRVTEIKDNSSLVEVSSFFAYPPGNQPSFFELTDSGPKNNTYVENAPSMLSFYFSDIILLPEDEVPYSTWFSENILITPPVSVESVSIQGQSLHGMPDGFVNETYTISLGPGIRSQSGTPLTPRTISFTCGSSCGLPP